MSTADHGSVAVRDHQPATNGRRLIAAGAIRPNRPTEPPQPVGKVTQDPHPTRARATSIADAVRVLAGGVSEGHVLVALAVHTDPGREPQIELGMRVVTHSERLISEAAATFAREINPRRPWWRKLLPGATHRPVYAGYPYGGRR